MISEHPFCHKGDSRTDLQLDHNLPSPPSSWKGDNPAPRGCKKGENKTEQKAKPRAQLRGLNVRCWRRQIPVTETREGSVPTPATGAHAGAGLLSWFPAWYQAGSPQASQRGRFPKGRVPAGRGEQLGEGNAPSPSLCTGGGGSSAHPSTHSTTGFGVTPPGTPEPGKLLLLYTDPWVCAPLGRAAGLSETPSPPHRGIPSPPTTAQSRQKLREWLEARGKGLQL